jgi:hypothetical protein
VLWWWGKKTSPQTPLTLNRPDKSGHLLQLEKEIGKKYLERGIKKIKKAEPV